MDEARPLLLELLAILALVLGPLLTYSIAKKKQAPELLLADLQAVKGWSEQRRSYEAEVAELHVELIAERDRRREERETYLALIDEIKEEVKQLRRDLKNCLGNDSTDE